MIWNVSILPYDSILPCKVSKATCMTVIDCLQLQGAKYRRTSSSCNGYEPRWKAVFLALYSTRPRKLHVELEDKTPAARASFSVLRYTFESGHSKFVAASWQSCCSIILDLDVVLLPFICSDISSLWHGQQNSSMHLLPSSTPSLCDPLSIYARLYRCMDDVW